MADENMAGTGTGTADKTLETKTPEAGAQEQNTQPKGAETAGWITALPDSLKQLTGNATPAALEAALKHGLTHMPVGSAEAVELPEALAAEAGWFKAAAAESGLSKAQVSALVNAYSKQLEAAPELMRQSAETELKAAFGQDYDRKIATATDAVKRLDSMSNGAFTPLLELGLGNHPAFIKAMAVIGEAISDSALPGNTLGSGGGAMSTEQFIHDIFNKKGA